MARGNEYMLGGCCCRERGFDFDIVVTRGFWWRGSGCGRGRCWVAAAYALAGSILLIFFITISHYAWRHFISLSNGDKETKQRKRLPTKGELVSLACRPKFLARK